MSQTCKSDDITYFSMVYPRIYSTDLDGFRLLAILGETGSFGGLTMFSCPQEGQENRAVIEGKTLYSPGGGAHALDFTKYAQEPECGHETALLSGRAIYVIGLLQLGRPVSTTACR
jgi:hypothetical protein